MMKIHVIPKLRHSPLGNSSLESAMVIRFGFSLSLRWCVNVIISSNVKMSASSPLP